MTKEFFMKNPEALRQRLQGPDMSDIIQQIMGGAGGSAGGVDIKDIMERIAGGGGGPGGGMAPMQPTCQLMLTPPMDLGMTPNGPMVIIGMPFFRSYYTTFEDVDPLNRRVLVSDSPTCEGETVSSRELFSNKVSTASKLHHVTNAKEHANAAMQNA